MSWNEFLNKLDALPVKAFGRREYHDGTCFCVVGAFVPEHARNIEGSVDDIEVADPYAFEAAGGYVDISDEDGRTLYDLSAVLEERTTLPLRDLIVLQIWNDAFEGTREERFQHVRDQVVRACQSSG